MEHDSILELDRQKVSLRLISMRTLALNWHCGVALYDVVERNWILLVQQRVLNAVNVLFEHVAVFLDLLHFLVVYEE